MAAARSPVGLDWGAWKEIQDSLPDNQMERWHLWNLHSAAQVKWLASELQPMASAALGEPVRVKVESTWVDCRPVAWFDLGLSSGPMKQRCELGDLLLMTDVDIRAVKGESKLLLQAKCTDGVSSLDADTNTFPGTTSTHTQRNLYEVHRGRLEVKTSGSAGAVSIGGPYPWVPRRPFSGYLLIPRSQPGASQAPLPYQVLWPVERTVEYGPSMHLLELMRDTMLLSGPWIGPVKPWYYAGREALIRDVLKYARGRPVKRFSSEKKSRIGRWTSAAMAGGAALASWGLSWDQWLPGLTRLYAAPPEGKERPQDGVPPGMLVLRISVRSDPEGERPQRRVGYQ